MALLRREDYPAQLPRPEPVLEFQASLWDASRDVAGVDIAWGDDIYQRIAIYPAPDPNGTVLAFIHGGRPVHRGTGPPPRCRGSGGGHERGSAYRPRPVRRNR
jgi:hypothetical protein